MYLIIGEENDVGVFTEDELKEFLSVFSGNIRIYRINGIKESPNEVLWHDGYVTDFFGNLLFSY